MQIMNEKHDGCEWRYQNPTKSCDKQIDHYSKDYELDQMKVNNPRNGHPLIVRILLQSLIVQDRPNPISLKFVNNLLQGLLCKLRAFELVLDDFLYLGVIESQIMLGQRLGIHVSGQGTVLDGGVRRLEHLSPPANMMLVDFFDDIVQFELG